MTLEDVVDADNAGEEDGDLILADDRTTSEDIVTKNTKDIDG